MSIYIRNIAKEDLISLAPQLTGFTDHNGHLVSGNIEGSRPSVRTASPSSCSAT